MKRRSFLKGAAGGTAALVVGSQLPWIMDDPAYAATPAQTLNFTMTDAVKDMATHNDINQAQCYFWIFKDTNPATNLPAEVPGPHIFATEGDVIEITLTNGLRQRHAFGLAPGGALGVDSPGVIARSGPIAPGQTKTYQFTAPPAGTYLYYDYLNEPVNRVMGLHGAFISMPKAPFGAATNKLTPYQKPTFQVQTLFNDLGRQAWWPGLSWQDGDPNQATFSPAFRQYVWLIHQASPNLFAEVGNYNIGNREYPAAQFINKFLHDRFDPASPNHNNNVPQYFTISGQSGHFAHNSPYTCPNCRVGEPAVIRWLNAGLWTHSMHIHANHVYVIGINGVPQSNPIWIDVYDVHPGDVVDWLVPYMRPPDVPNNLGIGRADLQKYLPTISGGTTWPPNEELNIVLPASVGGTNLTAQLSPLCYPMHDHSEPSQTSQGGNYNMGMISGMNFTGDRTIAGGTLNFPHQPAVFPAGSKPVGFEKGVFKPAIDPPWFA